MAKAPRKPRKQAGPASSAGARAKNPHSSAAFSVSINVEAGAPRRPTRQDLQALFLKAWSLIPVTRRPDIPAAYLKKLAVDVMVVDDAQIAKLNEAHLRHEGSTDVLSFPMGEIDPERRVFNLGEIVVSSETATREAGERKLPYEQELSRYCVHGFLHLLGYEDDTRTQREEMFAIQEKALT